MKKLIHLIHTLNVGKSLAMACLVWVAFCLPASDAVGQSSYDEARRSGNITTTNLTRAQVTAMTHNQMRETFTNFDFYNITDLVNATPSQLNSRQPGMRYMSVEQFQQAELERKMHVFQNINSYVIVRETSMIPKATITKAELNSYPAEKKKALLDTGNYIVID